MPEATEVEHCCEVSLCTVVIVVDTNLSGVCDCNMCCYEGCYNNPLTCDISQEVRVRVHHHHTPQRLLQRPVVLLTDDPACLNHSLHAAHAGLDAAVTLALLLGSSSSSL